VTLDNGVWGIPVKIIVDSSQDISLYDATYYSWLYNGLCCTGDGSRMVVSLTQSGLHRLILMNWDGTTYVTPVNLPTSDASGISRRFLKVAMSSDGYKLTATLGSPTIYYSTWDPIAQNYTGFTPTLNTQVGDFYNITMDNDGKRIVFGGGVDRPCNVYYSNWDETARTFGEGIIINTQHINNPVFSGFCITSNLQNIFLISCEETVPSQCSKWDFSTNSYGKLFPLSTNDIKPDRQFGLLTRDDSMIFSTSRSDLNFVINSFDLTYLKLDPLSNIINCYTSLYIPAINQPTSAPKSVLMYYDFSNNSIVIDTGAVAVGGQHLQKLFLTPSV